jgi:tetratricopeptide (TPR) repeat protein
MAFSPSYTKLHVSRLNPYNNRGNAKAALGDRQGAIADFNQAIRLDPNNAFAYTNRGIAKYELGDNQGAITDYQRAIELARAQGNQRVLEFATNNLRRLQR